MSKANGRVGSWVKEVIAPTFEEAVARMDEWSKSFYDMYVIEMTACVSAGYEDYVRVYIMGWENKETRERLVC